MTFFVVLGLVMSDLFSGIALKGDILLGILGTGSLIVCIPQKIGQQKFNFWYPVLNKWAGF